MSAELKLEIDQRAKEIRNDDTIVAMPGEQLEWLCKQLLEWPTRVDDRFTTNSQFLMVSAARTIADQAALIEELQTKAVRPIVVANISGGVLQGASSNVPVDLYTLDFDDIPLDDPSRVIAVPSDDLTSSSEAYYSEAAAQVDPAFVDNVLTAIDAASDENEGDDAPSIH